MKTLSPSVLKELKRLGADIGPLRQLDQDITWPRGASFCAIDDDYPYNLEFGVREEEDCEAYGGRKFLSIGSDGTGFNYITPADPEDPSDPDVYRVDHAGQDELGDPFSLSELLKSLMREDLDLTLATDVQIPDLTLQRVIRTTLREKGPITREVLAKITRLNATIPGIADLTGLELCTGLKQLSLIGNTGLTSLAPLTTLIQLEELGLGDHDQALVFKDVRALASLKALQSLVVYGLGSLSGFERFRELTYVDVRGPVVDLTPLAGLCKLRGLYLRGTAVTDLAPLTGLADLEYLMVQSQALKDLSPLDKLTKLKQIER